MTICHLVTFSTNCVACYNNEMAIEGIIENGKYLSTASICKANDPNLERFPCMDYFQKTSITNYKKTIITHEGRFGTRQTLHKITKRIKIIS